MWLLVILVLVLGSTTGVHYFEKDQEIEAVLKAGLDSPLGRKLDPLNVPDEQVQSFSLSHIVVRGLFSLQRYNDSDTVDGVSYVQLMAHDLRLTCSYSRSVLYFFTLSGDIELGADVLNSAVAWRSDPGVTIVSVDIVQVGGLRIRDITGLGPLNFFLRLVYNWGLTDEYFNTVKRRLKPYLEDFLIQSAQLYNPGRSL